jgi:hypothetical protein
VGRLTAITRGGASVDYAYDRFGRVTQDGAPTYAYDENDNRAEVGYPGGVSATYAYDFADRAASLAVQVGADPPQTVVSSAGYLPSGPLASLAFGNGLAEQRSFDGRYVPARIEVPGLLDAVYTTDGVGNILAIDRDGLVSSFAYQDVHYFLAESRGPWPARAWTRRRGQPHPPGGGRRGLRLRVRRRGRDEAPAIQHRPGADLHLQRRRRADRGLRLRQLSTQWTHHPGRTADGAWPSSYHQDEEGARGRATRPYTGGISLPVI